MRWYARPVAVFAIILSTVSPAFSEYSDLKVRCFSETRDDTGLVQSYTAEWCEDIGDAVPYFSLGRMVSPDSIYDSSAELHCQDKPKAKCIKCLNEWRQNYKELTNAMVRGKLISKQNRGWMLEALTGFYNELKTGCN